MAIGTEVFNEALFNAGLFDGTFTGPAGAGSSGGGLYRVRIPVPSGSPDVPAAPLAIAEVGHHTQGNGSTLTITLTAACPAGSSVVILAHIDSVDMPSPTATDNSVGGPNVYSLMGDIPDIAQNGGFSGNPYTILMSSDNLAHALAIGRTITVSSPGHAAQFVFEAVAFCVTGTAPAPRDIVPNLSGAGEATGGFNTDALSEQFSTNVAREDPALNEQLILAVFTFNDVHTITPTAPYTAIFSDAGFGIAAEYRVITEPVDSEAAGATVDSNCNWDVVVTTLVRHAPVPGDSNPTGGGFWLGTVAAANPGAAGRAALTLLQSHGGPTVPSTGLVYVTQVIAPDPGALILTVADLPAA